MALTTAMWLTVAVGVGPFFAARLYAFGLYMQASGRVSMVERSARIERVTVPVLKVAYWPCVALAVVTCL